MAVSFGLYLGTTNFSIAMHKDGKNEVLANDGGDRVTPSMVSFLDGEKNVGTSAKQGRLRNASSTISFVKHFVGNEDMNIKNQHACTCKIVNEGGVKFQIDDNGKFKLFPLNDVLVDLFKYMFDIGKRCSQSESFPSVVTIPCYFNEEMKQIVRDAATKAGFEVLRLIKEPAAAALAYKVGQESNHVSGKVLVFRVGGTSMDVTVLEISGGMYRIAAHIRKGHLGGDSITKCLVEFCCQEFQRQYKVDVSENKRAMGKIWNAAEMCKQGLTTMNTAQCCAESIHDGIDMSINISRARFESLIGTTLLQCLEQVDTALAEANITKDLIEKVILVGGSTKISRFHQLLKDKFSNAEVFATLPPDEVLALGAAEQATLIHGKEKVELKDVEVLSNSIYLKVHQNNSFCFYPVLKKGTPVPTKWHHTFHIPADQSTLMLDVYEGVSNDTCEAVQAKPLAKVVVNEVEKCEVVVNFQFANDSNLHITCTNKSTNNTESVTVKSANR